MTCPGSCEDARNPEADGNGLSLAWEAGGSRQWPAQAEDVPFMQKEVIGQGMEGLHLGLTESSGEQGATWLAHSQQ